MNKTEAIELLIKEDIDTMLKLIREKNLSVTYCAYDWIDLPEVQKWNINGQELIDFICYFYDFNLHWCQWSDALIEELKKHDYEVLK